MTDAIGSQTAGRSFSKPSLSERLVRKTRLLTNGEPQKTVSNNTGGVPKSALAQKLPLREAAVVKG
ncbi:MAG: hypothetical protein AAF989_05625, partial [Planctomycetota bacterium]